MTMSKIKVVEPVLLDFLTIDHADDTVLPHHPRLDLVTNVVFFSSSYIFFNRNNHQLHPFVILQKPSPEARWNFDLLKPNLKFQPSKTIRNIQNLYLN